MNIVFQTCPVCQSHINGGRTDRVYCSPTCKLRAKHKRRRIRRFIECPSCGESRVIKRERTAPTGLCSRCGSLRGQTSRVPWRTCARCGKLFYLLGWRRKTCPECFPAALIERRQARWREKNRRRETRMRLARRDKAEYECYSLNEIALRDGHRCGICHRVVAMEKRAPHPNSPSIDHILPLSAGGDDTKANVQLAHFGCNSRLGAGGEKQLRLIG